MITSTKFHFLPQRPAIILTKPRARITSEAHLTVYPRTRVLTTTSKNAKNMSFRPRNSNSQTAPLDSSNLPFWTASEIAEAITATIIKSAPSGTISTDSRTIQPGQWFFTIAGKNFDAHGFITPELQEKGCLGVIGNWVCKNWEKGFIKVEGTTVNSLKKLAIYARNRFCGCLIGLTGSVGKTTTRTMIALVLESIGEVYQSHGNWNNETGVAISLIGIPRNADFVVLELGMCEKGEILELARLCRPSIRVILNVGASHLENFESLEEVSMAKAEILRETKAGDVCILNADDPLLMSLPVPLGVKKVLFGKKVECDVQLVSTESTEGGLGVQVVLESNKEMVDFVISSLGLHLALNACAAVAVARFLGVSLSQIGISLSSYTPVRMRSELVVSNSGIRIINDVYNANPVSTKAAMELLKGIEGKGKRVAIIGDMLELGPTEIKFHEMVVEHCCASKFDVIALVGNRFLTTAENLNSVKKINIIHASNAEDLAHDIVKILNCDVVVLVKGSRATQMEKIVEAIKSLHSVISDYHIIGE